MEKTQYSDLPRKVPHNYDKSTGYLAQQQDHSLPTYFQKPVHWQPNLAKATRLVVRAEVSSTKQRGE